MQVILISPYLDITSLGTRMLSAALRRAGHRVRHLFLPDLEGLTERGVDFLGHYPREVEDQVVELCRGSGLAGVSMMTNYFLKARRLTRAIRERTGIPVAWGGVHPTIAPEECLGEADFVCLGEGEEALVDLAGALERRELPEETPNLWFRRDGRERRNLPRPLVQDLDRLPFPDYDLGEQFVLLGRRLVPLTEELLVELSRGRVNFTGPDDVVYETMWSRGCPYHCTFCINDALLGLYQGQRVVRRRSLDHLLGELEQMRQRFPRFNRINFADDCFLHGPLEEIRQFRDRYRERIGFPFFCLASVQSVREEKLALLFDAGLRRVEIGIQSAAPATNRLYRRDYFTAEKLQRCAEALRRHLPPGVVPTYDVILENPYEETPAVLETLRAAAALPRPFVLQLFSLTFFPGTELHRRALADGLIRGSEDAYLKEDHRRRLSYVNLLFILVNRGLPRRLVHLLAWLPLVRLFESRPLRPLFDLATRPYQALRARRDRRALRRRFGPLLLPANADERAAAARS